MKVYKPDIDPLKPPQWHEHVNEVVAIQALAEGKADAGQQALAVRFIIEGLAATYDMPYRPGSSRDTDLACGKMWVGQQIVAAMKLKVAELQERQKSKTKSTKRTENG